MNGYGVNKLCKSKQGLELGVIFHLFIFRGVNFLIYCLNSIDAPIELAAVLHLFSVIFSLALNHIT